MAKSFRFLIELCGIGFGCGVFLIKALSEANLYELGRGKRVLEGSFSIPESGR